MTDNKPQIFARDSNKILSILNNIIENEGSNPLINNPVLIGSHAAKWHISFFREPHDWDLVATPSQSRLFINELMLKTTFKDIKLIHYPGSGLKIVGNCIESDMNGISIYFDIELASDKMDLRKMRSREVEKFDDDTNEIDDRFDDKEYEINEIEFEEFNDNQPKMSAQLILELCHDVEDRALFPLSGFSFIVAPLEVLEALKSSHIYWPPDFDKNISDLHLLRFQLKHKMDNRLNLKRDEKIKLMLKIRIKETEIRQGVPGANKTNEEFFDHEDDPLVQRRISHNELHERVKYGERPIYETLKDDESKAWIKTSLFQQIDYERQLNCVREEAMVIALERYLIPMLSKNQQSSYLSALARICTTLTKGWFRQFAIDNYPKLSNLNKDLVSIAHDIINSHPLQQNKLDMCTVDQETRVIFNSIKPLTKVNLSFECFNEDKLLEYDTRNNKRYGIEITSPINNTTITVIVTELYLYINEYNRCYFSASVVIMPKEDLEILSGGSDSDSSGSITDFDPLYIHPFNDRNDRVLKIYSKNVFSITVTAINTINSGILIASNENWDRMNAYAKSADYTAEQLKIPGFTGDMLFKYVLAYLKPTLQDDRFPNINEMKDKFQNQINGMKVKGIIPIKPQQHLWYDIWNYTLKNKGGEWEIL